MLKKITISVLVILITILYFFPIYWMASSAVKPRFELYKYPPKFIPSTIVFDFFTSAIKDGVIRNISNSLFIGGITVIIVLFCSSLAGYAFARIKSKWGICNFIDVFDNANVTSNSCCHSFVSFFQ